jgi:hypothetical protein
MTVKPQIMCKMRKKAGKAYNHDCKATNNVQKEKERHTTMTVKPQIMCKKRKKGIQPCHRQCTSDWRGASAPILK